MAEVVPTNKPPIPPIAPAREAQTAGNIHHVFDYSGGVTANPEQPMMVVPVTTRPSDTQAPTMVAGINIPPPREMTEQNAMAAWGKMIADTKRWAAGYPYPLQGEQAHVLAFYRELESRTRMRLDAINLGRPVDPDQIDETAHVPPPEFFQLRDLARQTLYLGEVLQRIALDASAISEIDATVVSAILTHAKKLTA